MAAAARKADAVPREPSKLELFLVAQAAYALQQAFPAAHRTLCRTAAELQVLGRSSIVVNDRELLACRKILDSFERRTLRMSLSAHGQPLLMAAVKAAPAPKPGDNA